MRWDGTVWEGMRRDEVGCDGIGKERGRRESGVEGGLARWEGWGEREQKRGGGEEARRGREREERGEKERRQGPGKWVGDRVGPSRLAGN